MSFSAGQNVSNSQETAVQHKKLEYTIKFYFNFICMSILACMYVYVLLACPQKAVDHMKLKLRVVMGCHLGPGNQTQSI